MIGDVRGEGRGELSLRGYEGGTGRWGRVRGGGVGQGRENGSMRGKYKG